MGGDEALAAVLCVAGFATVLVIDMLSRSRRVNEHGLP
jgi:hypothetical protein